MKELVDSWQFWAVLSAIAAALTAIFAKVGVSGLASDFATLIRTVVVLVALIALVTLTNQWRPLGSISARSLVFLVLSGLATGASWIFYFRALKIGEAAKVAPIDKLSVVFVAIFAAIFLQERLAAINWLGIGLISFGAILVAIK